MPIHFETRGAIATITIEGRSAKNEMTPQMYLDLHDRLSDLDKSPALRAAVLRGAGDLHFSAGDDPDTQRNSLRALANGETISGYFHYPATQEVLTPWVAWYTLFRQRTVKPIVAAVRGSCLGTALTVVGLHTDLRVAGADATFGWPADSREIIVGHGLVSRLGEQIPRAALSWLFETGESIDAQAAHETYLINEVVPSGEVFKRAEEIAEYCAELRPEVFRAEKLALMHCSTVPDEAGATLGRAFEAFARSL